MRQLDRVSRKLLSRAWAAGAGPGDGPLTIDLDSTMCETYGLAKQGARHHGYTGQRGYHPLLAIAAGTGEVLMARLREGRANTARGAAHFLRETVGRVRHAGATGQLTVRADSGFYAHSVVSVCRKLNVRFSITIRQHARLRNLIEAIPETDWTPIPYWMDGAADVAETVYTPFQGESDTAPVRLVVRRVKPTPGSQLALFATYSYLGQCEVHVGSPSETKGMGVGRLTPIPVSGSDPSTRAGTDLPPSRGKGLADGALSAGRGRRRRGRGALPRAADAEPAGYDDLLDFDSAAGVGRGEACALVHLELTVDGSHRVFEV